MLGCSGPSSKSPDVSDSIRKALDQAGLKDVSVGQDRDKGIGGQVAGESDKSQAESLAKSLAGALVVADQIAVVSVGGEKAAKAVNTDLDQGIGNKSGRFADRELDARRREIRSEERRLTLTGEVNSEDKRTRAEKVAIAVPNVLQVVNHLQVKNQKASSLR